MKRLILSVLLLATACAPFAPRPVARTTEEPTVALPSVTAPPAPLPTATATRPVEPPTSPPPTSAPTATRPAEQPVSPPPTPTAAPQEEPTMAECRRWLASSQDLDVPIACADWAFFRPELFKRGGGAFPLGDNRYYLVWFPENWEEIADRKIIVSLHGTGGCAEWMLNHWYQTTDHQWVLVAMQYYDPATRRYDDDGVIYDNLRTVLAELQAHCPVADSDIFYHGFSRGSAQSFPVAVRDRAGDRLFAAFIADSGCTGLDYPTLRDAPADALRGAHFWLWCGENDISTVDPSRTTCQVMEEDMRPYVKAHGGQVDALVREAGAGHGLFSGCPDEGAAHCTPRTADNLGPSLPQLFEYIESWSAPDPGTHNAGLAAPAAPVEPSAPGGVGSSHLGRLVSGRERVDWTGAWIRPHPGPFIWGQIEVRPGVYDWARADRLVVGAQEQRLAILATVWPFAQWDQQSCHGGQPQAQGAFPELGDLLYAPCDPTAYAAWLTALVERYDGDGVDDMPGLAYPLRHWEIANEPEMQVPQLTFFQEGPEAYLELLRLSYGAVKAADPDAVVLTAGQAGMQSPSVAYWQPILEGAQGLFDLGNIHSIGSSDRFFAPEYRAWLDGLGYGDTGYWITEAVVGSGGRAGEPPLTEDELARLTFTSYVTAFGYGADVIIRAGGHGPGSSPGQAPERVFLLLADRIGDFFAATRLAENRVRFDLPDGRVVYALWDGATLPPDVAGTVKVITYAGEEAERDAARVVAHVPLLVEP